MGTHYSKLKADEVKYLVAPKLDMDLAGIRDVFQWSDGHIWVNTNEAYEYVRVVFRDERRDIEEIGLDGIAAMVREKHSDYLKLKAMIHG